MKLKRHNLILPILQDFFTELGYEWDTSSAGCGFSNVIQSVPGQGSGRLPGDLKLDAVAHWLADKAQSLGVDVTVWHACAEHSRVERATKQKSYITNQAETKKYAKYLLPCTERGIKHLPAAFNSYGGWGEVIMKEVVDPYYTKLRDAEREATGQEWMSLLRREFLFQRVSVAIARGNTMILNTMKQGWRSGRRAEEIRGVPPKAALDLSECSHVARLVAEGG